MTGCADAWGPGRTVVLVDSECMRTVRGHLASGPTELGGLLLGTAFLGERFEIFRFLGKTLLVGVDVPADFMSTSGAIVIKGLVGGDMFDAEQKGGTGCFPVPGHFNVLITSNSRLRLLLEGDAGAWRRRLLVVRYEKPPPTKRILDFDHVLLREEGSGILRCQGLEVAGKFSTFILRDGRKETFTPFGRCADFPGIETVGVPDPAVPVKTAEGYKLVVDKGLGCDVSGTAS